MTIALKIRDLGLVSIIIPAYNSQDYIAETIDSVISQTYTDWECIVIDDGSSDNTVEIVQAYIAQFPLKVKIYKNIKKGACAARNYGIQLSQGKFLKFLDSDDVLYNRQVLYTQVSFLIERNADIVSGNEEYYQNTFIEANFLKKRISIVEENNPTSFFENFPITSNFLLKKESLGTIIWNEKLKSGQEFFLLFQCYIRKLVFSYQKETMVKIRVHNSIYRISNRPLRQYAKQSVHLASYMIDEILTLKITNNEFLLCFWERIFEIQCVAIRHRCIKEACIVSRKLKKLPPINWENGKMKLIYIINSYSIFIAFLFYKFKKAIH